MMTSRATQELAAVREAIGMHLSDPIVERLKTLSLILNQVECMNVNVHSECLIKLSQNFPDYKT